MHESFYCTNFWLRNVVKRGNRHENVRPSVYPFVCHTSKSRLNSSRHRNMLCTLP